MPKAAEYVGTNDPLLAGVWAAARVETDLFPDCAKTPQHNGAQFKRAGKVPRPRRFHKKSIAKKALDNGHLSSRKRFPEKSVL
jgi:hypothetical protein